MSRSALWRQEGNVKEREQRAQEIFEQACQEGRSKSNKSALPLWGPDDSFQWNPLLLRNTITSPYFQKCCERLLDWNAVIDEIYYEVKHLQPFQDRHSNKNPSTAFCLLLRLLTMRLTPHQMDLTLKHPDSPYIRGIAFLYLRYAGPPDQLWQWLEPYVHDEEEITVEMGGGAAQAPTVTMGMFVRQLFSQRDYYGTPLPRLPVQVEREIQVKLLHAEKVANRAEEHFQSPSRMEFFQKLGNQVMALYGDDENPIQWYRAVVDRVITRSEEEGSEGRPLKYPKFVVTFPEYGNTETVLLGEMDMLDGSWKDDRFGGGGGKAASSSSRGPPSRGYDGWHRGGGRHGGGGGGARRNDHPRDGRRPPAAVAGEQDLYEEVRQRERENVLSSDRRSWAKRPPTTKHSLSQPTHRHSSIDEGPPPQHGQPSSARDHHDHHHRKPPPQQQQQPPSQERKRTAEELAAIAEKKRKLMAKYG